MMNKNIRISRIIAIALSLTLIFNVLPATAIADDIVQPDHIDNNSVNLEDFDNSANDISNDEPAVISPLVSGDGGFDIAASDFDPGIDGIAELWIEGSGVNANSFNDGRKVTDMINWRQSGGKYYLMVPESADLSNLKVYFRAGGPVMAGSTEIVNGQPTNVFTIGSDVILTSESRTYTVAVRKSSPVASMFIATSTGNLTAIHANQDTKEAGKILLVGEDGTTTAYNGDLEYIKGRGNATWGYAKKPYNLKLGKKAALLGMGNSKKWCLLANYIDNSHIRNLLTYHLAEETGIEFASKMRPVDLYINNDYMGLYFLAEKVEIGDPLVDIVDLEGATEAANGGADLSTFTRGGPNSFSKSTYKYFNIPNDPADITGGFLLEWELSERYANEVSGFVTSKGQAAVIKYPEHASKRQVEYIREFVQDMENAVYSSNGVNSKGKHYSEYIDEESFSKMYVLQEFTMNLDAAITSFYIYKDSDSIGDGKLHAAPPWDFDNALGNHGDRDGVNLYNPELWWAKVGRIFNDSSWTPHLLTALNKHKSFTQRAVRIWHTLFAAPVEKITEPSSTAETRVVKYAGDYANSIRDSAAINRTVWNSSDFNDSVNSVISFARRRAAFLTREWSTTISDLEIELIDSGIPERPDVTIMDLGFLLEKGKHFGLSYSGSQISISGKGFYTGTKTIYIPTVTSVTISPENTKVPKGETLKFSATVNGSNNPAQTVSWTVEGGVSKTAIDSNGILSVSPEETAGTLLTVRATSTLNTSVSGTATVTVAKKADEYIPVRNILNVPDTAETGTPLFLTGTVEPRDADSQLIEWSVKDEGETGAAISDGNTFIAISPGTATVTATIADGLAEGADYTQDFLITVNFLNIAVTGISLDKTELPLIAGTTGILTANVSPLYATNKSLIWTSSNPAAATVDTTGVVTGIAPGNATITVTSEDGGYSASCKITVYPGLSINPGYSVVKQGSQFNLEIEGSPAGIAPNGLTWEFDTDAFAKLSETGSGITLTALESTPVGVYEVSATATVNNVVYIAHADVYVVRDVPVNDENYKATILQTKTALNTAKTQGALVTVKFSDRTDQSRSLNLSAGSNTQATPDGIKPEISGIKLYTGYNTKNEKLLDTFAAELIDDRTIEIRQADGKSAKTVSGVTVVIGNMPAEGNLSIAVSEKYPKITFKSDTLDLFYPKNSARIIAESGDGEAVTCEILEVVPPANGATPVTIEAGDLTLTGAATRTGSVSVKVLVKAAGYEKLAKDNREKNNNLPNGTIMTTTVKIVNNVPKLKLNPASIAVEKGADFTLRLSSADKNKPLSNWSGISGITSNDPNLTIERDESAWNTDGIIKLRASGQLQAGKKNLLISFAGGKEPVAVPLTVSTPDVGKASLKTTTKAVTVHDRFTGRIIDIDLVPSISSIMLDDSNLEVTIPAAIESYLDYTTTGSKVSLATKAYEDRLPTGKHVIKIKPKADSPYKKMKEVKYTLTVTDKPVTFSSALNGKIDTANPLSEISVKVKLANTTAAITNVILYDQKLDENGKLTEPDTVCKDFEVVPGSITDYSFKIKAKHDKVVPSVKQNVSVEIELSSGEIIKSWAESIVRGQSIIKDKPIAITPSQTIPKAALSKKEITLYKSMPKSGEEIAFTLTSPANVKLGDVSIADSTSNAKLKFFSGGFELVRNGKNSWSIRFKGGEFPTILGRNNIPTTMIKAAYTVNLELWAEGTYELDKDDKPIALKSGGKEKSKPTVVKVKVIIN